MADTKKNALAELAERLSSNKVELVEGDEFPIRLSREAVIDFRKARRIVNGCQVGGYQCARCGEWFCGSELNDDNLCADCEEAEAAGESEVKK